MTSTAFIIQYTDENDFLNDTFRLSDRIPNCLNDVLQKVKGPAVDQPRLLIELLFSNCEDIRGFQKMMEQTEYEEEHTHFPLMGRQEVLSSDSPGGTFFRAPIGLPNNGNSACELDSGDIFPCALLEGAVFSG